MAKALEELFISIKTVGANSSRRALRGLGKTINLLVGNIKTFQANLAALAVSGTINKLNQGLAKTLGLTKDIVAESTTLAGNRETIQQSLAGFLGSETKSNELLRDLTKFGAETPFQVTDLREYSKALLGMGFEVESIIPNLRTLGDLTGGKRDILGRILFNFGQIKTTGRASLIDIRQFAMAGIPIFQELEKTLEVDSQTLSKMISDGKIGLKEVEAAFASLTGEGGAFNKQMERTSKTFQGRISNLVDSWEAALEKMGDPLIRQLKPVIDQLQKTVVRITPYLTKFGEKLGTAFQIFARILQRLGGADFLGGFVDKFGNAIINMARMFEDFVFWMRGERSAFEGFIGFKFDGIGSAIGEAIGRAFLPAIGSVVMGIGNIISSMISGIVKQVSSDLKSAFFPSFSGSGTGSIPSFITDLMYGSTKQYAAERGVMPQTTQQREIQLIQKIDAKINGTPEQFERAMSRNNKSTINELMTVAPQL